VIAARSGQAAVEWMAVMAVTTALAVGAATALRGELGGLAAIGPALVALAQPPGPPPPTEGAPTAARPLPPLPTGGGEAIAAIALQLHAMGIEEQPPGSNAGPEVLRFTDGIAEAWCADFVSWVLRAAGRPFTGGASGGWRLAWTPDVRAWFAARGRYRTRDVAHPQPGDVIWFRRGHVGIVVRADQRRVEAVEGNAGDAVRLRVYDDWRANPEIDGFGRP
jgi:hypothetical protein